MVHRLVFDDAALALRDRGDIDVSQPWTYLLQNFRKDFVLQPGSSPDERDFFIALDRLDGVDVRGHIDERRSGELILQRRNKCVGQRSGSDEANRAMAVPPERVDCQLGIVAIGIADRRERWCIKHLADAAMQRFVGSKVERRRQALCQ